MVLGKKPRFATLSGNLRPYIADFGEEKTRKSPRKPDVDKKEKVPLFARIKAQNTQIVLGRDSKKIHTPPGPL